MTYQGSIGISPSDLDGRPSPSRTVRTLEQRAMFCCKCVGKKTHLDGMLKEDVIQDHHEQQEWNDSYHDYQQYRFYFGIISKTNLQCSSLSAATSC